MPSHRTTEGGLETLQRSWAMERFVIPRHHAEESDSLPSFFPARQVEYPYRREQGQILRARRTE
jgi:hypothetical protein